MAPARPCIGRAARPCSSWPRRLSPPPYLHSYVLNPFNQGWDGSSALSRFVHGSLEPTGGEGAHFVRDPRHPVGVHLIAAKDLLQVVARGYDTECLGPSQTRDATAWTIGEFESRLVKFKRRRPPGGPGHQPPGL